MKKNYHVLVGKLVTILFFLQISTNLSAQIVHVESFDSTLFLPTGWTTIGGTANWSRVSSLLAPLSGPSHSGAGMARMRYPVNSTVAFQSESIVTPAFTLVGRGSNIPTVSFWIYRDSLVTANPDSLAVYINSSLSFTGATLLGKVSRLKSVNLPDVKALNGWYQYTFPVPAGIDSDVNYLIFKGTMYGPQAVSRRIYIDDINWEEYPVLCAGTPVVGNVTASDTLICSGSGIVDLTLNNVSSDLGLNYAWFSAPTAAGPWTVFGTNATSATSPLLTSTRYFKCTAVCSYGGLSASSVPLQVFVSPNPIPVVSAVTANDTICNGEMTTLIGQGANSYEWSSPTVPILSLSTTVAVFPTNTTVYTVIGTDINGCKSQPSTITIGVGQVPVINGFTNSSPIVCLGGTSTLTVNASGGLGTPLTYSWMPNMGTTPSITVSSIATTNYVVSVFGQFGCFTQDSVTVTVNPALTGPLVTMNIDTLNACTGTTGTSLLIASTPLAGATYQWSASTGGTISSVNDSLQINIPLQSTVYTVLVTNPANGCNSSATTNLIIRPIPSTNIETASQTICLNGTAALSLFIGNTGGEPISSYSCIWTPSGQLGTNVIVSPTTTGYQVVNVTSSYGCSKMDSILITVNTSQTGPQVSLTASDTILCAGSLTPINLFATSNVAGASYSWTPSTIISTNDTIIVNPTTTTSYTVGVIDANGCASSALVAITINQPPLANFSYSTGGFNDAYFTNTSPNVVTSQWNFGDGTSANSADPSHLYPLAGNYTVTLIVTDIAGCSDTISKLITVGTAGIDESTLSAAASFVVFPNPSNGLFNVQFNSIAINSNLKVLNLLGQEIFSQALVQSSNGMFESQIDLSDYPNGIYLIDLKIDNQTIVKKISKQ